MSLIQVNCRVPSGEYQGLLPNFARTDPGTQLVFVLVILLKTWRSFKPAVGIVDLVVRHTRLLTQLFTQSVMSQPEYLFNMADVGAIRGKHECAFQVHAFARKHDGRFLVHVEHIQISLCPHPTYDNRYTQTRIRLRMGSERKIAPRLLRKWRQENM